MMIMLFDTKFAIGNLHFIKLMLIYKHGYLCLKYLSLLPLSQIIWVSIMEYSLKDGGK